MINANEAIAPVHNRMPVLLHPGEHEIWLQESFDDALALQQRTFPPELITIDRTSELWPKKKVLDAPLLL
ncbi:SOS response-associated peptidase family protein [Shinella sp.]|uniref:SOS response-associated peptidase family protein n=1 Tax=Shinella sp. TaxID=1870904 RepID=UPI003F716002